MMGLESSKATPGRRAGEVVESASHWFRAQCYQLYQAPALGAFVSVELPAYGEDRGSTIYAVVMGIITQSLEPGRPVIARGGNASQEEDVYRDNPQLERLLCTRFESAIVGYSNGHSIFQHLPPEPPHIHAFVNTCGPEDISRFTTTLDFLELLLASNPGAQAVADEVVSGCLRQASMHQSDPRSFLVAAGKTLSLRLAMDLPRLNAMLGRLSS